MEAQELTLQLLHLVCPVWQAAAGAAARVGELPCWVVRPVRAWPLQDAGSLCCPNLVEGAAAAGQAPWVPLSEAAEEVPVGQPSEVVAGAAWEVRPCWCRSAWAAVVAGEPSAEQRQDAAVAEAAGAPRPCLPPWAQGLAGLASTRPRSRWRWPQGSLTRPLSLPAWPAAQQQRQSWSCEAGLLRAPASAARAARAPAEP